MGLRLSFLLTVGLDSGTLDEDGVEGGGADVRVDDAPPAAEGALTVVLLMVIRVDAMESTSGRDERFTDTSLSRLPEDLTLEDKNSALGLVPEDENDASAVAPVLEALLCPPPAAADVGEASPLGDSE